MCAVSLRPSSPNNVNTSPGTLSKGAVIVIIVKCAFTWVRCVCVCVCVCLSVCLSVCLWQPNASELEVLAADIDDYELYLA